MEVSVVMVTWNVAGFIRDCLDSLKAQSFRDFDLVVVDNGSADGSRGIIVESYPGVRLIENPDNQGFCRANNTGINASSGRYVLTLNGDVTLEKDFIEKMVEAMEAAGPEVGMVTGKMLRTGTNLIDSTGLVLSRARRFYDRGGGEEDNGQHDTPGYVFGPCAGAALYRREMLDVIRLDGDYFDSDFFFLGEDFDLAWRAQINGWKAVYTPLAVCHHMRGSSEHKSKFKQFLSFRNRYYLILKNDRVSDLIQDLPRLVVYDCARLLYLLFTNRLLFRAAGDIIGGWGRLMSKRRSVQYARKVPDWYIRGWMA